MKLAGKRVLITGGTKGIGAAIAVDLAAAGADVAINSRSIDADAEAVVGQIQGHGRKAVAIAADMSEPQDVQRCVAEAADALGGIDILVHSAGGPAGGTIDKVTPEHWRSAFAVHVDAAFYLCQAALPLMKQNAEGAILLISSAAGIRGCPGALTYCTVKGAILQFTRALARDVADDNIRVNCLSPGIIRTRFHDAMTEEQKKHNLANRIPLHREGTSEDVAEAAHLLITNEFMTGESIVIDGGMTMQIVR